MYILATKKIKILAMKLVYQYLQLACIIVLFGCESQPGTDAKKNADSLSVQSPDSSKMLEKNADVGFKLLEFSKEELPAELKFKGKIKEALKYKDINGEHIVITTETGVYTAKSEGNDFSNAELFSYRYTVKDGKYEQTMRINDFVRDCPLDIEAKFVEKTFQITDLNKNGVAEIWVMYRTACRGDVSPSTMKIIMFEGDQKYAIRGENKVLVGDMNGRKEYMGGKYTADEAIKNGPKEFLEFGIKLWEDNVTNTR
jgi:hypothetical protein